MTLRQGRIGWVGLLAAVVCLAGGRPAPAQTTLRYKYKEGDKLRYATTDAQAFDPAAEVQRASTYLQPGQTKPL